MGLHQLVHALITLIPPDVNNSEVTKWQNGDVTHTHGLAKLQPAYVVSKNAYRDGKFVHRKQFF